MLKIFGNWWKGIKGVQLCACSHLSGYATNLFTCRLTYLAPFARAQFLVLKLGGSRLTYWDLDVSSFFLLSFFLSFSQSASSSTCLIGFLPNLVRSKYGWMATKLMGLKIHPGSFGVTGVKKMILRKTLLLLQITWYGLVTNLSCNGLTLSTKVMGLEIHPGSFGVTGVKNVNFYCLNDWIRRLTD